MSYLYFGLPSNFSSFSEEEQNKFLARVNNNQGKKSETQITAEQGKSKNQEIQAMEVIQQTCRQHPQKETQT